jgi:acetyl-CoA carboxylase biotin carboxyl carrier protein
MAGLMSSDPAIGELLALIDRLEALLEGSELSELEVEAAGTTLILRKPSALAPLPPATAQATQLGAIGTDRGAGAQAAADEAAMGLHAVVAPLTGVFYLAPSPGAAAYVREGGPVSIGQVIGLIEAMKLFNEIKSDVSGTVRRIAAESGALVKQKQALIEVEPA